jgi:FKBP-type peptidyl-prolyl cis-trans isomerase SlyD
MIIEKDKVVQMHYTLTDSEGTKLDSSEGKAPLAFIQGVGNIIPGLEKQIEGKLVGEKVTAIIPPEEAYGLKSDKNVQTVEKAMFQEPEAVKVGAQFHMKSPEGVTVATVAALEGETVTLDLNHPLAGVTLHFDVEIVSIREATEDELSHGHAHGEGGHHHE